MTLNDYETNVCNVSMKLKQESASGVFGVIDGCFEGICGQNTEGVFIEPQPFKYDTNVSRVFMEGKWEGVKGVLGVVDGSFEVTHGND